MTYGITTAVRPLSLNKKQIVNLVDQEYEFNNPIEYVKKEEETITTLCKLLQLLDVDRVLITQSGSKLDCHLKIDVAVKQGDRYIGFQVKSSKCGYDKYCSTYLNRRLSSQYNGHYDYKAPGCVWLNKNTDKIPLLVALSDWLDIAISNSTKDAIMKYKQGKKLQVRTLSSDIAKLLNITIDVINIWITLDIAKFNNGVITYLH